MEQLEFEKNRYVTKIYRIPLLARIWPSFYCYIKMFAVIVRGSRVAKRGLYDDAAWAASSKEMLRHIEEIGNVITIEGIEHLKQLEGPCVIIGNHMSMMETVLLPVIVSPVKKVTFVIKESLLKYPIFKHVMRSCNPVAVTRTNPRQDLKTVMTQGLDRLKSGRSVIVFPQTTRAFEFSPEQMSSIGVKLAKKAGVPVVPMALKTDAWTNGKKIKDLGKFDLSRKTFFRFGKPMEIEGKGKTEQEKVNDFIASNLSVWRKEEQQLSLGD